MKITDDIKDLFRLVRLKLGGGVRAVQITDESLCALLEIAIKDYGKEVQQFIIESQWMTLYGKNKMMNQQDLMYALTTRTLDYSKDFSYWFSKEVGLQQRGKFELKKDFFEIEKGKQVYLIPKGREINKVMYCTPSTTKAALYGNYGVDTGFGMGISQLGNMGGMNGLSSFYFGSMYDVALSAASMKFANSMLRGDLTYKVTALASGEHLVHLMSTPGSPNQFGGIAIDDRMWGAWSNYVGCYVWYTYYDTEGASQEDIDDCRIENTDVIISPDTVPLKELKYEYLNEPSKSTVRQLLTAEAMMTLAFVRGYASGKVSIPTAEMTLDYGMFLDLGKEEKRQAIEDLKKYLEKLLPINMIKQQAEMSENLTKMLSYKPMQFKFI